MGTEGYRGILQSELSTTTTGAKVTTFAIGGALSELITVQATESLAEVVRAVGTRYRILGNGSNLIIADEGLVTPVIKLGSGFRTLEQVGTAVTVGGSYSLMTLARETASRGLAGLEFAGGIPASVGGAVRMNAGAHGGEIFESLTTIRGVTKDGDVVEIDPRSLPFRYRHSGLPEGFIVTQAVFSLTPDQSNAIDARRASFLAHRKATQPLTLPCAGSVFKNPSPQLAAGKVLDDLGMKGTSHGGAKISEKHANWIVNESRQASAADVHALISLCQQKALTKEVALETEIITWSDV